MFPSNNDPSTVLLRECIKVTSSTLLATNLKGVVPLGFGLNLKRMSDDEKLSIPVS